MTDADKTNDILTGHGDAAPVINTDGVARADHAEVTDDGRAFLTASGQGEYYTPPEVVDAAQGTGAFLAEAVPSYDELRQACGELEWELVGVTAERARLIAVTEQRDRAWKACTDTFHECQKDEKGCDPFCCGPILLDVMARLQAVVAEAAEGKP